MQFSIPPRFDTWGHYGVDGNGDGVRNVYDPADAIPGAGNLLAANNGAAADLAGAEVPVQPLADLRRRRPRALGRVRRGRRGHRHAARWPTASEDAWFLSDDETDGFSAVALW